MKRSLKILVTLITIIAVAIPLSSCSPAITKEDAEKELVSFMLDFIIQQKIRRFDNECQFSNTVQVEIPFNGGMIVLLPPNEDFSKDQVNYLRFDEPLKVWLYVDNKLEEVTSREEAFQKYREIYVTGNLESETDFWFCGAYEFGITSISRNNTKATIYLVDAHNGEVKGGMMYTVRREELGKWRVINAKLLWSY